jgi:geranylgeranyl pyrophosphate synthase
MLHLEALLALIERKLENSLAPTNGDFANRFLEELTNAHKHPVEAGGKRLRPLIVLLMAGLWGGRRSFDFALAAAGALELVHTYSLVHDDLPCMDNDALRRGKPTTHTIYGQAKGLLVGDGLLTQAFALLGGVTSSCFDDDVALEIRERRALFAALAGSVLARAAGMHGMVLGQWMDISEPNEDERKSWEFVRTVAALKTGKLLGVAFELGLLAGLSTPPRSKGDLLASSSATLLATARRCGEELGIAFQVTDDLLDVTASTETMGKTVGKDAAQDKVTSVSVLGLDGAREMAAHHTARAKEGLNELMYHPSLVVNHETLEFRVTLHYLVDSLLDRRS